MTPSPSRTAVRVLAAVTARVQERSADSRAAYLGRIDAAAGGPEARPGPVAAGRPRIAVVTGDDELPSAHPPSEDDPRRLEAAVAAAGGVAQVAGRGAAFGRGAFDGALLLGGCDAVVPGLLSGALESGHLPAVLVPAGPRTPGLPGSERSRVRQLYAEGKVGRAALLEAESAGRHGAGTCPSCGPAGGDPVLLEVLGLHLPGAGLVSPGTHLREALVDEAGARVVRLTRRGGQWTPVGHVVDEKAVLNAVVALLATGTSTDPTPHLVPVAAAAGVRLTRSDVADLLAVVPRLTFGHPDVDHARAAGGTGCLVATLLDAELLHEDVLTVAGRGLSAYGEEPTLADGGLSWQPATAPPAGGVDHLRVPVPRTPVGAPADLAEEDLSWAV